MMLYPVKQPRPPYRFNYDAPLAQGLVMWMPLVDSLLRGRIKGATWTASATAPLLNGNGPSFRFTNASSTYLSATSPVTAVGFTFACWYWPTTVSSARDLLSIANSSNTADYFNLQQYSSGAIRVRSSDSTSQSSAVSATLALANQWQLAVGTVTATNARAAYLNGGGKGTSSSTRSTTGVNTFGIGANVGSTPASFFDGYISNVCLWNRVLSDNEIWQLWDPSTRWQLYETKRIIALGSVSAAGIKYPSAMDGLGTFRRTMDM